MDRQPSAQVKMNYVTTKCPLSHSRTTLDAVLSCSTEIPADIIHRTKSQPLAEWEEYRDLATTVTFYRRHSIDWRGRPNVPQHVVCRSPWHVWVGYSRLQIYREILKKLEKGHKQNKIKFEKTGLDNHIRNVMPEFQSCGLNGVATIEKIYIIFYPHR